VLTGNAFERLKTNTAARGNIVVCH